MKKREKGKGENWKLSEREKKSIRDNTISREREHINKRDMSGDHEQPPKVAASD